MPESKSERFLFGLMTRISHHGRKGGVMAMSRKQRQEQRYGMFVEKKKNRFMKVMRNPELHAKVMKVLERKA